MADSITPPSEDTIVVADASLDQEETASLDHYSDFSSDDYDQDLEDELNDFDGWDNATGGRFTESFRSI